MEQLQQAKGDDEASAQVLLRRRLFEGGTLAGKLRACRRVVKSRSHHRSRADLGVSRRNIAYPEPSAGLEYVEDLRDNGPRVRDMLPDPQER